jgi:hypothetical protein
MPRYKRPDGYIEVKRPDIATTKSGYMKEHRAVWIDNHGSIPDGAVIHHINGDRSDNRIENLEMYETNGEHRHECHVDLSWLDPDRHRLQPFDLVDMMFIRSHLPLDRI